MSVDIKATYGAKGDGQIATVNATFNASSNNLTVFSNIFVSGDIGKYIAVGGWVTASGGNPAGVTNNTISSISSAWNGTSMTIVLGGSAAGLSAANASTMIEWGSDDAPAFVAFNTAQAGQSNVALTIPAGRYLFVSGVGGLGGSSVPIGKGISTLVVTGTGGPTLSDMLGAGSGPALNFNGNPLFPDNTKQVLIQTVSAGASVLNTVTASDAGKFSVGNWAWMTGYDVQGFGSPPNPRWSEFVQITAVDSVAGTIAISVPLKNGYKSTWPNWVAGGPTAFGLGGPATLYMIDQAWNADHTWTGVNFRSTPTLQNGTARKITISNATFESFGPNVSFQQSCTCNNISVPTQWELDKGTENFTLTNSTVHGFRVDNPSPFNVTLDTCTINNQLPGTTLNWSVNNCNLPSGWNMSPASYGGAAQTISLTNNTFNGPLIGDCGVSESAINTTGAWTISNGLMSRPLGSGTGEPPQFAVPGSYFVFGSRYNEINPVWKCVDIYSDGVNLYLQTDQSTSSFPSGVNGATALSAAAVFPQLISYSGNSGADDATGWVGQRIGQHWLKTYTGAVAGNLVKVWGQFVSLKVTIGAGYSAGTFGLSGPFIVQKPSNNDTAWNPQFDLTQPGTRVITASSVIGSLGTDANLTPPNSGNIWLVSNQIVPVTSGAVGSGSVTLEIIVNQGFPSAPTAVAPLRWLLHA